MTPDQTSGTPRRLSSMRVLGLTLLAIYLPVIIVGIGLFFDPDCAYRRMDYLKTWIILPGIMIGTMTQKQMPTNTYLLVSGFIWTPLFIACAYALGRLGRWWLIVTLLVAFLFSYMLAGLAGAIIRA